MTHGARVPVPTCTASTVEAVEDLRVNGKKHAGVVTHCCDRPDRHLDKNCRCACGKEWEKFR